MTLEEVLQAELQKGVVGVQQSLKKARRDASGRTSRSVRAEVKQQGNSVVGTITAPFTIELLETGRKPTRSGKRTPISPIMQWIKDRSLSHNPWAVAAKIDKEGFKGTPGLITDVLDDRFVNGVLSAIRAQTLELATNDITETVNQLNRLLASSL